MKATFLMCIASALLGSIFAISLTSSYVQTQAQTSPRPASQELATRVDPAPAPQDGSAVLSREFTPEEKVAIAVYDKVNRSVVNIRTVGSQINMFSLEPDQGAGSGWVYDNQGHVVTNAHVVEDSRVIEVTFYNGENYEATVVGEDPANDIAVLKVSAPRELLVPIEMGESDTLRVGQRVYAIGNPFGLERTMTEGIVSSLNRTLQARTRVPRAIKSIIQIDAALNRGNSGGPLLDTRGLLIGMNTAIATSTGENTGVGFAIPANNIHRIVPLLIRDGRIIRASLGIALAFETYDGEGVGIYQLVEGGPAAKAGLRAALWYENVRLSGNLFAVQRVNQKRADIIVAIEDQPIRSAEDLIRIVESFRPGDQVTLRIRRQGRLQEVGVTLAEE